MESWTCTEADLVAWLDQARPGDRFVYAKGPTLVQGAAAALVKRLGGAGDLTCHNQRNHQTGSLEYVVVRNRPRVAPERARIVDPNMFAVLLVIQEAAQEGRRCPSDAAIGEQTGLSAGQVKWQLKRLCDAKQIDCRVVATPQTPRFRIVKVLATGCETAGPTQ